MNNLLIVLVLLVAAGAIAWLVVAYFRQVLYVPEGQAGLVYHHGLYVRRNNVGRHIIWGRGWTIKLVDLRRTSFVAPGQDVLTSDNVRLKGNLLISYQVTDPARAAHETQNYASDIHYLAQLALRAAVNNMAAEALLGQKLEIGAQLLARIQPEAIKIGVNVLRLEVDFVPPEPPPKTTAQSNNPQ
jgi:regulator of protease activity HflC (stomatin/prohibitin superfamily)